MGEDGKGWRWEDGKMGRWEERRWEDGKIWNIEMRYKVERDSLRIGVRTEY